MQTSAVPRRSRQVGGWYILYLAFLTVCITVYRAVHPNGWTPGDWLINYTGGFVPRGLPGECILLTAHLLHFSPVLLASFVPLFIYLSLYAVIWELFRRSSGNLWTLAALLSPATLAFPILDPVGAFRKELLFLLVLAVLLAWLARARVHDVALTIFLTVTGVGIVLSHEGLLAYLLYLVGALVIGLHDLRRVLKLIFVPTLAVCVALLAVLHHRGTLQEEQIICRSIQTAHQIVCSGSIAYLATGTNVARQDVVHDVHAYHYLFYYPVLFLLALVPFLAMAHRLWRDRRLRPDVWALGAITLLSLLASIPLFLYAMDWGRWIYIHIMSLFMLLLFMDLREARSGIMYRAPSTALRAYSRWAVAALVVYATCWNLPHYGNYPKKGYLNLPLHLLKQEIERSHHTAEVPDLGRPPGAIILRGAGTHMLGRKT